MPDGLGPSVRSLCVQGKKVNGAGMNCKVWAVVLSLLVCVLIPAF